MILAALVLATIQTVVTAPPDTCHYIDQWRGTNVPISPGIPSTDIIHAIAVSKGQIPVGWLVFRRDGMAWYFDGAIRWQVATKAMSVAALNALGLKSDTRVNVGTGAMIPLHGRVDATRLAMHGFRLDSCF